MHYYLTTLLLIASLLPTLATTRYVSRLGNNTTGSDWTNAYTNIPTAVVLMSGNDITWVDGGTNGMEYGFSDLNFLGGSDTNKLIFVGISHEAGRNYRVTVNALGNAWPLKVFQNAWLSGNNGDGTCRLWETNASNLGTLSDTSTRGIMECIRFADPVRWLGITNCHWLNCQFIMDASVDYVSQFNTTQTSGTLTNNSIIGCEFNPTINSLVDPTSQNDMIQALGPYVTVQSNYFHSTIVAGPLTQHQDGIQCNENAHDVLIRDNTFENIINYSLYWEFLGGIDFDGLQIYNNVFQHTSSLTAGGLSVGVVIGPQGVNNHTYQNIHVDNNTFVDYYGRAGIAMGQTGRSNTWLTSTIRNNIAYNCGLGAAISFENNFPGGGAGNTNGMTIAYNLAIAGANGVTNIFPSQIAVPATTNFVFTSYTPLSAANNLVPTTSPVGLDLSSQFTTDKNGATRTLWDLGAYNLGGSTTSTNPPLTVTGNVRFSGAVNLRTQ